MKRLYLLLFLFALPYILKAVVAYPHPIDIIQKDGSHLTICLHGNEWNHFTTTIDGYKIQENEKGIFVYQNSNVKANNPINRSVLELSYISSIKIANSEELLSLSRAPKAPSATSLYTTFPRVGSPRSLVILVNFTDTAFITPDATNAFNRLLNEKGYSDNGATGSTVDYFKSSSYGKFTPEFDVVGPFNIPNTMRYYGANDANGNDSLPTNLIVDACKLADLGGVDFSKYDLDNDSYIDNVFVYYAGRNEAEGGGTNTIWPHRWAVVPGENYNGTSQSIRFDGKKLYSYACTSELKGSTGTTMCGIGTFTHEFGHVLGMVDYYHTASATYKKTLEYWSIMDIGVYLNGGRTPPVYSTYDRFYLGWLNPEMIKKPSSLQLNPISQDSITDTKNQAYLFAAIDHNMDGLNPNPAEFFMLEYRKKTGWDSYLKDDGMLIWHIDYNQEAWDSNGPNNYINTTQTQDSHMRVYLQPLIGQTSTPGTTFKTGNFTPVSWQGDTLNRVVSNISMTDQYMSFAFMGGQPEINFTAGIVENQISFAPSRTGTSRNKSFKLSGNDFSENLELTVTGENASMFTVSVSLINLNELLAGKEFTLKYSPSSSGSHTATLRLTSGTVWVKEISLSGSCE